VRVLLDTCVLSELHRAKVHPAVQRALESLDEEELFVSVVSIGEITKGISLLKAGRKKRELEAWLQEIERDCAGRLLPVDLETGRIWGELTAAAQKAGRVVPATDGLIAATALRYGLRVMTRNSADFEPTGVLVINPWAD
jgi:toxin FitB